MTSKQVALVVDAAIELHPQHLKELGIFVVPRAAKIGGRRQTLTIDYTGYSVVLSNPRPRKVALEAPSRKEFENTYVEVLQQFPHVLSIHMSGVLDQAVYAARLARNLAPEAHITIFEMPLLGFGLAKMVETVAEWSQAGATPEAIASFFQDNLLSYARSFFIAPSSRKLKSRVQANNRKSRSEGFFSKQLLALSVDERGYFKQEGQARSDSEIAAELRSVIERIPQIVSQGAYLDFIVRPVGMEAVLPNLRSLLASKEGSQEQTAGGWSPALSVWFGERYVEISSFPTSQALTNLKAAWESGRRFEEIARLGRSTALVSRLSEAQLK